MNKERRKRIEAIMDALSQAYGEIEEIRDEEEDAYDNLPENFQEGSRGDAMQDAIDNMETALAAVEEAKDTLEEVINA